MDRKVKLSEMVAAMKEKAETAYLNGEIATARHLATIALENWPDGASINEISWCFAILLYTYKNDTDYWWITTRFYINNPGQKMRRYSINDSDEGKFIEFILEILHPSISPEMMEHWRKRFIQMRAPQLNDDVFTALLLETTVEMLCFFGMDEWESVGMHFVAELKSENGYVSSEVLQCVHRLSLQMRILAGEDIQDNELDFLPKTEKVLALAWKAYYRSDFRELDTLIPALSNAANCGDEYFLAIQGLVTATNFQRKIAQDRAVQSSTPLKATDEVSDVRTTIAQKSIPRTPQEGKRVEPWQYAKYYRYQRFETEQPLAAFFALREANAEKVAHQIREKALSGETVASKCSELLRLLPGLWGSALKYWDLPSLIKLFELKMEFHWVSASYFNEGEYSGKSDQAVDAIICGIVSLNSEPYRRKDAKQLIGILERYGSDEDIRRLYNFIFSEAPPITWNLCVEWLLLLGDLLPEDFVHMCLDWTTEYHAKGGMLLTAFNIEEYYYLHPILQHYSLSEADQKSLKFHFESMFRSPPHKVDEFKTVLRYLADNDWEMCKKLMAKMLLWDTYPRTQSIIINSCADLVQYNKMTEEFCIDLLEKRGKKTNCELYSRFARIIRDPKKAEVPNLNGVYTAFKSAMELSLKPGYDSEGFQNVYDYIDGFNWGSIDRKLLQPILEIATPLLSGEKTAHPLYLVDTLSVLCRMFQSAADDAKQMLIDTLLKHIGTFRSLLQPKEQRPQVWDTFVFNLFRPELLHNKLLFAFCQNYDGMTLEQKSAVLSYTEENLYFFPNQAYYPTYLFLRAIMDDTSLYSYAHSGFAQLRMSAAGTSQDECRVVSEILRGIASAQEASEEPLSIEKTKAFVFSVLECGSTSLNAENRLQVADLVKVLPEEWLTELQGIRKRLAEDKRKSVRNAILAAK